MDGLQTYIIKIADRPAFQILGQPFVLSSNSTVFRPSCDHYIIVHIPMPVHSKVFSTLWSLLNNMEVRLSKLTFRMRLQLWDLARAFRLPLVHPFTNLWMDLLYVRRRHFFYRDDEIQESRLYYNNDYTHPSAEKYLRRLTSIIRTIPRQYFVPDEPEPGRYVASIFERATARLVHPSERDRYYPDILRSLYFTAGKDLLVIESQGVIVGYSIARRYLKSIDTMRNGSFAVDHPRYVHESLNIAVDYGSVYIGYNTPTLIQQTLMYDIRPYSEAHLLVGKRRYPVVFQPLALREESEYFDYIESGTTIFPSDDIDVTAPAFWYLWIALNGGHPPAMPRDHLFTALHYINYLNVRWDMHYVRELVAQIFTTAFPRSEAMYLYLQKIAAGLPIAEQRRLLIDKQLLAVAPASETNFRTFTYPYSTCRPARRIDYNIIVVIWDIYNTERLERPMGYTFPRFMEVVSISGGTLKLALSNDEGDATLTIQSPNTNPRTTIGRRKYDWVVITALQRPTVPYIYSFAPDHDVNENGERVYAVVFPGKLNNEALPEPHVITFATPISQVKALDAAQRYLSERPDREFVNVFVRGTPEAGVRLMMNCHNRGIILEATTPPHDRMKYYSRALVRDGVLHITLKWRRREVKTERITRVGE